MSAFVIMLFLVATLVGAPIASTNSYNEVCADGTHPTACAYRGSSSDGYETSMASFTDNLSTGETFGEIISTKVLNSQEFFGSYMFTSDWGTNAYLSITNIANLTTRFSFYSNPGVGVYSAWGSKELYKTRSVFMENSLWDCYDPTKCQSTGSWTRSDNTNYSGTGWWVNLLNGELTSGGEWQNFSQNFNTEKGGWKNTWDSTGGSQIPEPATYAMMGLGLAALGLINLRNKKS